MTKSFSFSAVLIILFSSYLLLSCKQNEDDRLKIREAQVRMDSIQKSYLAVIGKKIFYDSCSNCHGSKQATDFLLRGVAQSLGEPYFKLYITKQDSLIKSKNKLALAIKQEYGNMGDSHNFKLNEEQLRAIIEYLR